VGGDAQIRVAGDSSVGQALLPVSYESVFCAVVIHVYNNKDALTLMMSLVGNQMIPQIQHAEPAVGQSGAVRSQLTKETNVTQQLGLLTVPRIRTPAKRISIAFQPRLVPIKNRGNAEDGK
jgi:hypothetical protein